MQFIFDNDTNSLLPFLLQAKHYILNELPAGNYDKEGILDRCRFIITELCTNAIKHSGEKQSEFNIYIENSHLIIERRDKGKQLHPIVNNQKTPLPLPDSMDLVTLTEDDINRLNMKRIDGYSVRFYVEEITATNSSKQQTVNEHFGLIIICQSSDKFTYSFHAPDSINVFTADIELA